jgi:hypothetical protein
VVVDLFRRRGADAEPEVRVGEQAFAGFDEGIEFVGRVEQARLAVTDDLGNAADRGRDDGTADRERLDDRVREVLPRRRSPDQGRKKGRSEGGEVALDDPIKISRLTLTLDWAINGEPL